MPNHAYMVAQSVPEAAIDLDEERLAWRKGLTEGICRSLAMDYLRGLKDECNKDAYDEYQHRFGEPQGRSKLPKSTTKSRYKRRM